MNENDIYTILQRDGNLREAIRLHEDKKPPMPSDLNERLAERLEEEQEHQQELSQSHHTGRNRRVRESNQYHAPFKRGGTQASGDCN